MDMPQSMDFCPRLEKFRLYRPADGKTLRVKCNCYKCDFCRPKKINRFRFFTEKHLEKFTRIRLMTLTARNDFGKFKPSDDTKYQAIKEFAEIFRRFINNLRRNSQLSSYYQQMQYIKVIEFTKNGYPHYHLFIDRYMPYLIIQEIWNEAVNQVRNTRGTNGRVNIKHSFTANGAGRYLTKYLTKTAEKTANDIRRFRLWSKSGRIALFPKIDKSQGWLFLRENELLNLSSFIITSHETTLFKIESNKYYRIDHDTGEMIYIN